MSRAKINKIKLALKGKARRDIRGWHLKVNNGEIWVYLSNLSLFKLIIVIFLYYCIVWLIIYIISNIGGLQWI
jgi:hypothetical protein